MQQQGLDDTAWDIMSGTAVATEKRQEIILSAKGMTKTEFDELICLFSTELNMQGWKKSFSGYNLKDDLEVRFKLRNKLCR